MELSIPEHKLKRLDDISALFRDLPEFDGSGCEGEYQAEILGPGWLKAIAIWSLPFAGLPGWCGKRIFENGAVNRCLIKGQVEERVEMHRTIQESWIDGRSCLVLGYDKSAPLLLRPMRDEFRRINDSTLLGLSIYNLPGLKRLPLPFLLKQSVS